MRSKASFFLAASVAALAGCAGMHSTMPVAVADLKPTQGNTAQGHISFTQQGNELAVEARFTGLTPGKHGIHIHEKGDCGAPDGSSAGGHFNPTGEQHGDPAANIHHAGDLGNLTADADGNAVLKETIPVHGLAVAKDAPNSIVGRAVILHASADDFTSQPAGNSGKRVACGVIAGL